MIAFPRIFSTSMLLACGALSLPFSALAQDEKATHPKKPFLWKVEGNGLEKPSYLFGTIHISTPEIRDLHPTAAKAFDSAETLYTEIPLDPKTQLEMTPRLMRKDGTTLSASIGEEITKDLDAELARINPALNSQPFQSFETWGVTMILPILKYSMAGEKAIDARLWERATEQKKKTDALETAESQFAILGNLTEEQNKIMLAETLKQLKEDRAVGRDSVRNLVDAYIAGDEKMVVDEFERSAKLLAESEHKELGEMFMKRLLTDRDLSLAATIDERLQEFPDKIQFFAVGVGHLAGEAGICSHLTKKGYRITRIKD